MSQLSILSFIAAFTDIQKEVYLSQWL